MAYSRQKLLWGTLIAARELLSFVSQSIAVELLVTNIHFMIDLHIGGGGHSSKAADCLLQ